MTDELPSRAQSVNEMVPPHLADWWWRLLKDLPDTAKGQQSIHSWKEIGDLVLPRIAMAEMEGIGSEDQPCTEEELEETIRELDEARFELLQALADAERLIIWMESCWTTKGEPQPQPIKNRIRQVLKKHT